MSENTKQSFKNMTDLELVTATADILGIDYEWHYGCGSSVCLTKNNTGYFAKRLYWNPLASNDNALVLAAMLKINVMHQEDIVRVERTEYGHLYYRDYKISDYENDRCFVTRRAIVELAVSLA